MRLLTTEERGRLRHRPTCDLVAKWDAGLCCTCGLAQALERAVAYDVVAEWIAPEPQPAHRDRTVPQF